MPQLGRQDGKGTYAQRAVRWERPAAEAADLQDVARRPAEDRLCTGVRELLERLLCFLSQRHELLEDVCGKRQIAYESPSRDPNQSVMTAMRTWIFDDPHEWADIGRLISWHDKVSWVVEEASVRNVRHILDL